MHISRDLIIVSAVPCASCSSSLYYAQSRPKIVIASAGAPVTAVKKTAVKTKRATTRLSLTPLPSTKLKGDSKNGP